MSSSTKTRQIASIIRWPFVAVLLLAMTAGPAYAQNAAAVGLKQESVYTAAKSDPEAEVIGSEIQHGRYASAESDARASLRRHPDSSVMHNLLGYVLYRENKPKESLGEYTAGARYGKPGANDLAVAAMDYILLADYPDADKWLTVATEWEPGNALYWYYLGRTKYQENRFQEAITAFHRTLALKPKDIRSQYNLGLALAGLGRVTDAEEAYKTAIEWGRTAPLPDPQPYLDLGLLLDRQGQTEDATPYLATAVKLDARNPKAHEALGRNYERRGEFSKAEAEYRAAVSLAPNISALHFELGRTYRKEDRNKLAEEEFSQCAALNKAHSTDSEPTPNISTLPERE
ncbi:MAG TPA: tetratricopeptide repeat protein [Candidatus Angelobacter sp.]|nr:tetratricopeptide repeat protein [Candidatus Angelobacter sp.]